MKVHIGARHLANAIDGSLRRQCGLVLSLLWPLFGSYPYTDRYAAEFDVLRHPAVAAAVVAVYVVVIIVGTLGSLLVFVSVVSTRQMWTATNVFIANLALTDLIVCAVDLPLSLHYQVSSVACRPAHRRLFLMFTWVLLS